MTLRVRDHIIAFFIHNRPMCSFFLSLMLCLRSYHLLAWASGLQLAILGDWLWSPTYSLFVGWWLLYIYIRTFLLFLSHFFTLNLQKYQINEIYKLMIEELLNHSGNLINKILLRNRSSRFKLDREDLLKEIHKHRISGSELREWDPLGNNALTL